MLVEKLGLTEEEFRARMDRAHWPAYSKRIAEVIKRRSREDWMKLFEGSDACVAPVLSMDEAPKHPHNVARETFQTAFGVVQPGPAPRVSRTAGAINGAPATPGKHSREVLQSWGVAQDLADSYIKAGAVVQT